MHTVCLASDGRMERVTIVLTVEAGDTKIEDEEMMSKPKDVEHWPTDVFDCRAVHQHHDQGNDMS